MGLDDTGYNIVQNDSLKQKHLNFAENSISAVGYFCFKMHSHLFSRSR